MPQTLEQVEQIALELPAEDRRLLAQSLWESLGIEVNSVEDLDEAEFDSAWEPEIASRVAEIKAGTAVTYSLQEVEADLRAIVGK